MNQPLNSFPNSQLLGSTTTGPSTMSTLTTSSTVPNVSSVSTVPQMSNMPTMQTMSTMPMPLMPTMMPNLPPNLAVGMPPMMQMIPMMAPVMNVKKGKGPQPIDKWINVPPNNTIYVNNLNEKITRDEIMNGLREVFGQYGNILDVVCYTKIKKCKGQAWIVFEKTESATNAIRELQNFSFFNKPLHVSYSKNISDATLKRDGKEAPKRERPEKKKKKKKDGEEASKKARKKKKKQLQNANPNNNNDNDNNNEKDVDMKENLMNTNININNRDDEQNEFNTKHTSNQTSSSKHSSSKQSQQPSTNSKRQVIPPNKLLFLQNLPLDATQNEIESLFRIYPGFSSCYLIESKPGIGFVEYIDIPQSTFALQSLNHCDLRGHNISVTFAKQ